jgi:hypothetical protein
LSITGVWVDVSFSFQQIFISDALCYISHCSKV